MAQNISQEVAALRRMTPAQLREKYLEVFGEPTRSGNKDFLCKRLAWRLQSLAEGGLSERARQRAGAMRCACWCSCRRCRALWSAKFPGIFFRNSSLWPHVASVFAWAARLRRTTRCRASSFSEFLSRR